MKSKVKWLSDDEWGAMKVGERALHVARSEYNKWLSAKEELRRLKKWGLLRRGMESLGKNWGPSIKKYLRAVGYDSPAPWCAAFCTWCLLQAGWSPGAGTSKSLASACTLLHGAFTKLVPSPVRGCLGGWCNLPRWQGHVFFVAEVKSVMGITFIRTIEGNSNDDGSREGNEIVMKWRRVSKDMVFVVPRELR